MRLSFGRSPEAARAEAARDRDNKAAFVERFKTIPGFSELEGSEIDIVMDTVAPAIGADYQKWNAKDAAHAEVVRQAVESIIESRRMAA